MFKQSFIISSILIVSTTNTTPDTYQKFSFEYVKNNIPQSIKEHPKKTIIGGAAALYGLKLIYEGSKTHNIQPGNGAYNLIELLSYVTGTALTIAGVTAIYKAVSSETEDNKQSS